MASLSRISNPGIFWLLGISGKLLSKLFGLTSAPYAGSLKYYTSDPIDKVNYIHKENASRQDLVRALIEFRHRKEDEFTFTRRAAGLSAAAVIAGFTWPVLDHTYWVTTMFWHWSLTASIFSLISSAQDRLLNEFPNELPSTDTTNIGILGDPDPVLPLVLGRMMFWVWQTPMMLMSYGWALFLIGYFIVILAPLFDGTHVNLTPLTAGITAGIRFLVVLNFVICSRITMAKFKKLNQK